VQTFYQPLFSNSSLAISLQSFFSLPKAFHTKKAQSKKPSPSKSKSLKQEKPQSKGKKTPKQKP
jgi:hypothetical protein